MDGSSDVMSRGLLLLVSSVLVFVVVLVLFLVVIVTTVGLDWVGLDWIPQYSNAMQCNAISSVASLLTVGAWWWWCAARCECGGWRGRR